MSGKQKPGKQLWSSPPEGLPRSGGEGILQDIAGKAGGG